MLKFESLAKVGDTIRSYDFMGNREAYIQGTVIEKGWMPNGALGYTIQIDVDGADWGRAGDTGYVAYETSLEYDGRVELVNWDNRAEEELAIALMKEFA